MGLTIVAAASDASGVAEAKQAAADALAAAQNARQMVLSRDPGLNDLKSTAAQFGSVTAAADAIHAHLEQEIVALRAALAAVQTTPGATGPAGPAGATGERGATGFTGQQGLQGSQGLTGPAGSPGAKGDAGAAGVAGVAGQAGLDGAAGSTGATGAAGATGATGPAGTANLALGAAPVGAIVLNGNSTVVVTLSQAMPNNTYAVRVVHTAVLNVATVTLTVTAKTTTSVTVKVTSVGVALLAGSLVVVGY